MPRLGMDVDAVESAGRALKAQADRIDGIIRALDRTVKALGPVWEGPTARRFIDKTWPGYRTTLIAAREQVAGLGQSALNNASEQRKVSSTAGSTTLRGTAVVGAPLATSTRDVVTTFTTMGPDELIRINEVVGSDGVHRYVVYINGTLGKIESFNVQEYARTHGWFDNLPASFGMSTPSQELIAGWMRQRISPDDEVMIVGYSQGGMIAQSLASSAEFNVKEVLTIGSPPVPTLNGYDGANVTRLVHNGDQVENLVQVGRLNVLGLPGDLALRALSEGAPFSNQVTTFQDGTPGMSAHDVNANGDYQWLAERYDASTDPRQVEDRARQAVFLEGTVVAT